MEIMLTTKMLKINIMMVRH